MSELHVYKNDCEWYVAASIDDAWSALNEWSGNEREELEENDPFELVSDDEIISIVCNEDGEIDDCGESVSRTAAEWAKREGRGLLCTTEY